MDMHTNDFEDHNIKIFAPLNYQILQIHQIITVKYLKKKKFKIIFQINII